MSPHRLRSRVTMAFFVITVLIASSIGSAFPFPASAGDTQYYFINGVSVAAYRNRRQSARFLQTRLKQTHNYPTPLQIIALSNPSQGMFSDIFQKLVLQKQLELNGDFKSAIMQTVQIIDGDPSATPQPTDEQAFDQGLAVLDENIAAATEYTSVVSPTLQAMCARVISSMQAGHPVVIVGHSEGTMYANEIASVVRGFVPAPFSAAGLPMFSNWLKVVDIATPASSTPDSDYLTAKQDIVITDLASALSAVAGFGAPLPANTDFPNAHQFDPSGHGIATVYLNPQVDPVRDKPRRSGRGRIARTA